MNWLYHQCVRPLLFAQDSESIHTRTLQMLGGISQSEVLCDFSNSWFGSDSLPVKLWGLDFPNPVGLAAGMDKYADAVPAWESLGFGFAELGGVTWLEQEGNEQPRMFRVIPEQAIINRMGFNNPGAPALAARLQEWKAASRWPRHPIGINLGKSKITPLDRAAEDYANSFIQLSGLADFFVVNVSSPNTLGLRELQHKEALDEILRALQELNQHPATTGGKPKPILVKIAPDIGFEDIDDILDLVETRQIAGLIATNTTVARPHSPHPASHALLDEPGGLSGRPLKERSTEIIRYVYRQTQGQLPIVGVGGIFSAEDAWEKITAGATLIQIYTGLIYEGPTLPRQIVRGLRQRLDQEGFRNIEDAVGTANRR